MTTVAEALRKRNRCWSDNPLIPAWVDIEAVELDQFFTKPEIARHCINALYAYMKSEGAKIDEYTFVEPAAGGCAFYNELPENRRIGIDILPLQDNLIEDDFLSWKPDSESKIATIGNPPFGYRAWLAMAFLNHAALFSDYVGFVLPMAFQSDGKGSPKLRIRGLKLVHTEYLPEGSFTNMHGKPVKVNALYQIWERGVNNLTVCKPDNSYVELFTIDNRAERLCGQEREDEADCFVQRTFYGESPKPVKSFSEVKYRCGYGVVIKKQKPRVNNCLNSIDWRNYSNLAAHNCRHISMYHIYQALADKGFE